MVLSFSVMRNEMLRLPFFLKYYRGLGVGHFLIVVNDSTDGTEQYLTSQPDVSVWTTSHSYRDTGFGRDWSTYLLMRYGHGHWCLTLDSDEILVFDGSKVHGLPALSAHLDALGQPAFGALMLEPYPKGPVAAAKYMPGDDPMQVLTWFDADGYHSTRQDPLRNLWLQGGVRERVFFAKDPARGPTLNKLPLVKWHRKYAYVNSTHSMQPRAMNLLYDGPGDSRPCGVLLHSKFLSDAVERAHEDLARRQHFHNPDAFVDYNTALSANPDLWSDSSVKYIGPQQFVSLGLMSTIDWQQY